jgi:hypothetical protein
MFNTVLSDEFGTNIISAATGLGTNRRQTEPTASPPKWYTGNEPIDLERLQELMGIRVLCSETGRSGATIHLCAMPTGRTAADLLHAIDRINQEYDSTDIRNQTMQETGSQISSLRDNLSSEQFRHDIFYWYESVLSQLEALARQYNAVQLHHDMRHRAGPIIQDARVRGQDPSAAEFDSAVGIYERLQQYNNRIISLVLQRDMLRHVIGGMKRPEGPLRPSNGTQRFVGAAVNVAQSCLPVLGEYEDTKVLADPHAAPWERCLAGFSLGINVIFAGLLPNYGTMRAANEAVGEIVLRSSDEIVSQFDTITTEVPRRLGPDYWYRTSDVVDDAGRRIKGRWIRSEDYGRLLADEFHDSILDATRAANRGFESGRHHIFARDMVRQIDQEIRRVLGNREGMSDRVIAARLKRLREMRETYARRAQAGHRGGRAGHG